MRVFKSETAWDKIEQQWYQSFEIDGDIVDMETYCMELEVEQTEIPKEVFECQCPDCVESDKEDYLTEAVNMIMEGMCPQHIYEMLQDIFNEGYGDGFEEGMQEMKIVMQDFLED